MFTISQLVEEYLSPFSSDTSQYQLSNMLSDLVYELDQEDLINNDEKYDKIVCKKTIVSYELVLQLDNLAFVSTSLFDIRHVSLFNSSKDEYLIAFIGMPDNIIASTHVFNKLRNFIDILKTDFMKNRTKRMKPKNRSKRAEKFIEDWIDKLKMELECNYYENKFLDNYIKENFHTIEDLYESMKIPLEIAKLFSDKKNATKTIGEVVYSKYSRELIREVADKMDLLSKEDLILFPHKLYDFDDDYM